MLALAALLFVGEPVLADTHGLTTAIPLSTPTNDYSQLRDTPTPESWAYPPPVEQPTEWAYPAPGQVVKHAGAVKHQARYTAGLQVIK